MPTGVGAGIRSREGREGAACAARRDGSLRSTPHPGYERDMPFLTHAGVSLRYDRTGSGPPMLLVGSDRELHIVETLKPDVKPQACLPPDPLQKAFAVAVELDSESPQKFDSDARKRGTIKHDCIRGANNHATLDRLLNFDGHNFRQAGPALQLLPEYVPSELSWRRIIVGSVALGTA